MNENQLSRRELLKTGACAAIAAAAAGLGPNLLAQDEGGAMETTADIAGENVKLPEPDRKGKVLIGDAIAARRSKRSFKEEPVALTSLSTILWAAQGVTEEKRKFRAAPSAGALFPMDVFVVVPGGVYRYEPAEHSLKRTAENDRKDNLCAAALSQKCISSAPFSLVITAEYERCAKKYGDRAERYCKIEAGLIAENVSLLVAALELGAVIVGAFHDEKICAALSLDLKHRPLLIMPVGKPQ